MAPATPPSEIAETRPAPKRHLPWKVPLVLLVLLALAALLWHLRGRIAFDWHTLVLQLRAVSLTGILVAIALTYIGYCLRAWRWSVLLSPVRNTSPTKISPAQLFPAQLIGFTVVALFGRVADLARPYLIARRSQTPVATQLAIYSVERAFDLAAAAILFSVTLAVSPRNIPHHEAFTRAGALSLAGTLLVVVLALALRFSGELLARFTASLLHPLSPGLAASASARILDLRNGFRTVSSLREFLTALALSLVMWTVIAFVYVESTHTFHASPPLATLSFVSTMLLLATGLGGSLFQLPVLGWFTQIAVYAAALHAFFSVPLETATACGAVLLVTTTLCVIPAGLLAARIQGIALRDAAHTTPT